MIENLSNDSMAILAQVLEEMKQEKGNTFVLQHVNLSELERRTGISRKKLRNLRDNDFKEKPHGRIGKRTKKRFFPDTLVLLTTCCAKERITQQYHLSGLKKWGIKVVFRR